MAGGDFSYIVDTFLTPIKPYLEDSGVSEVLVNGPGEIYIESRGRLHRTDASFGSDAALMAAVSNIAQYVERRVDTDNPILDARLPDGSRVHVVLPPCSRRGICLAIRKFSQAFFTREALTDLGTLDGPIADFVEACVRIRRNLVFSGGSGTGKTSLLNFASGYIPEDERILVIEDASELQLQQEHIVPLEVRFPDRLGRGEVNTRDLVRSSLRMRPDRIIVGECRGGEALDMLQAMNTGHAGSMTTVHANSPRDALLRLETMSLMGGVDLSWEAVRAQIASAIHVVIHASRMPDGSRKITRVTEITGLGEEGYLSQDLFAYRREGIESDGRIRGRFETSSGSPSFWAEVAEAGLEQSVPGW